MTNKKKCFDLFQKAKVNNKRLHEKQTYEAILQFKIKKYERCNLKQKLLMLIGLNCFKGHMFIKIILKILEITIELFVIDIETGNEVFISNMIS